MKSTNHDLTIITVPIFPATVHKVFTWQDFFPMNLQWILLAQILSWLS